MFSLVKPIQVGRKLRVNGQDLLTLEYDRESKTMAVFMEDRLEVLNVTYDRTARPVKWIPKYVLLKIIKTDVRGKKVIFLDLFLFS